MAATAPVLYLVCCAAPPALNAASLIALARDRGWDTCLIGLPVPIAVVPGRNDAQAAHPAHAGHLATLRGAGVNVLSDAVVALDELARSLRRPGR